MRRGCWLLLLCLAVPAASAQQPAAPEPILRVSLDPPRVVVGQPVMLRIDLLAPNYLTAPPVFPELQLRNAVTRPLSTINMSEQHEGVTFAGVRREFAIHPQEAGSYEIANQTIGITYAAAPPATRTETLALPRLSFDAFIPEAAQTIERFIAATKLTLRQSLDGASGNLQTGDAVVRTVTLEAEGIPAMLLPPLQFRTPDGLAVYPDQPLLQEKTDRRTDELTATRIERATYMLQKPGDYELPPIDIAWWNLREQRVERLHADPVVLRVAPNPSLPADASGEAAAGGARWQAAIENVLAHWPLLLLAIAGLIALAISSPRLFRSARDWVVQRRAAYAASEAASFAHLRAAARRGDARATYFALLAWLARFDPVRPDRTLKALRAAAQDPELDRQLTQIETRLFAAPAGEEGGDWHPWQLLRPLVSARRRLLRRHAAGIAPPLSASLNPPEPRAPTHLRQRAVAR